MKIVWVLCFSLFALSVPARAEFKTIDVDGDVSDWQGIASASDPVGDALSGGHDLTLLAVANDQNNLYFRLAVNGADGDYFGNSSRIEELTIYLDIDSDLQTGSMIGPEGQQIGAEYCLVAARRIVEGAGRDTSFEGTLYRGDRFAEGGASGLVGNFSNTGLPKGRKNGGVDSVTEFETMVPIFRLVGVKPGASIALMVRATRSGANPQQDWLDQPYLYTVATAPDVNPADERAAVGSDAP